MNIVEIISSKLSWLSPRLAGSVEARMKKIPAVQKKLDNEYDKLLQDISHSLKPYEAEFENYTHIPQKGLARSAILEMMQTFSEREQDRWAAGYVSGAVYHGDQAHIAFLNQVYALQSQSNPLHSDLWPSTTKFEAEIIAMTAAMLGKGQAEGTEEVCGTISSGGTESIMLAMKSYRDYFRESKGIQEPEMLLPVSAHPAFDKAAQYFQIKPVKIPVDEHFAADVSKVAAAINKNTIVIVGSAPSFPHGIIDPIEEMSELALAHGIGFHTDACLGAFVLPWAEKLGYDIPPFDFRLPGVTSMSADTHKYGYAAKGTSVVLYRHEALRHFQYFTATDWPGGLYFSPSFAGSRPGALSAACWASMLSIGEAGYLEATKRIFETAKQLKKGIAGIPELKILGDPFFVIAIGSDELNIYQVLDQMTAKGWNLNGLHKPPCFHLAITQRQTQPGVADRFIADLKTSVAYAKENELSGEGMAPVYGMANSIPFRGMVSELLKRYIDVLYKVKGE
jgi:sphinganine-1-phosphate aldolase